MTPIRNMLQETLIAIVEQCCLDSILMRKVDRLPKCTRFMEALTQRAIANASFYYVNCTIFPRNILIEYCKKSVWKHISSAAHKTQIDAILTTPP